MTNKKKLDKTNKVLIAIFVVIVLLIGLLFSYAYYSLDVGGTLSNSNITGTLECLDISYTESNSINLTNAYPVTDDYALTKMTPVTVTITNNCSSNRGDISYTLALSTIYEKALNYDDKYIPDSKIRTHVKKTVEGTETTKIDTKFLSKVGILDPSGNSYKYITNNFTNDSNYTNYNIKDMYKLDSGLIKNNEVITYKVYMWIDYYEGDPERVGGEYNNSTKGKKFEGAISLVANAEEYKPPFAEELIASGELWQSGLEGDGYRYTGTGGATCSYDNGKYVGPADNQYTTPSCSKLYNYTRTTISSGATTNYTYQTRCPSNNSTYTYSCTELDGTLNTENINTVPNNFICFGTTSLEECKVYEDKYMYRIIGVFPDEFGKQHLKLIKYRQLSDVYMWNSRDEGARWEDSDLYRGLNGMGRDNLFIGSNDYPYLQVEIWLNKIVDWKWTATNTLTTTHRGPDYYDSLPLSDIYLHEMNRSTKSSDIGEWTHPTAKIGLMYVSDYTLSLGSKALTITGGTSANRATLKMGWMHQSNNIITRSDSDWTISRIGSNDGSGLIASGNKYFAAWRVGSSGFVGFDYVTYYYGARPVFYLDSAVTKSGGTGSYDNPYLISEID